MSLTRERLDAGFFLVPLATLLRGQRKSSYPSSYPSFEAMPETTHRLSTSEGAVEAAERQVMSILVVS
jgi:hypothetical protein